jgi:hypothetical protein
VAGSLLSIGFGASFMRWLPNRGPIFLALVAASALIGIVGCVVQILAK